MTSQVLGIGDMLGDAPVIAAFICPAKRIEGDEGDRFGVLFGVFFGVALGVLFGLPRASELNLAIVGTKGRVPIVVPFGLTDV